MTVLFVFYRKMINFAPMIPKFLRNIFGADDATVEFDDIDRPVNTQATAEKQAVVSADGELSDELLNAILSVINSQFPPIVAECIDCDAQRNHLAALLGQPLADFTEACRRKAISELTGDRAKMQSEIETLRSERKEIAEKREEQKATLLSEQRQRRALSDRNRDLEAKIDQLDSEIEQHKLTISSLMNKMRVAEVSEGNDSALQHELDNLRDQLAQRNAAIAAKDAEILTLGERIANLESVAAETAGENAAQQRKRRSRSRRQTPAYDPDNDTSADIDSVDWLLPGGAPAGHVGHVFDPDFGYQPPKQAPEPDSDSQLTLF